MIPTPIHSVRFPKYPRRFLVCLLLTCGLIVFGAGRADNALADSTSRILTVTGKIAADRYPSGATFDRDALIALGLEKLETETHFTKGMQSFDGVRLTALLNAVGADGTILTATGLDGYSVDIPIEDAARFNVFLALNWNGAVMKVRNKGPVWIVYPISQFPEVNTEVYSARSVWQLKTLAVK